MSPTGLKGTYGEELYHGGEIVLRAAMFDESWFLGAEQQPRDETRCCAKVLWDRGATEWMKPLVDAINGIRVYHSYWLNQVQKPDPADRTDSYLHTNGRNLWSVLANWKASPTRFGKQFEWVLSRASHAFPGLIESIEFDRGLPLIYMPGRTEPDEGLSPNRAPDGLLTGLLHLTAIAGARSGGLVAFDEVENQLHPHAIRSIVSAMRERAEDLELTILLTTHSPVVMNEFKGHEDLFFVLEPGRRDRIPTPLFEAYDSDWLAHFTLGDLYEREEFASPR
jgi:predicted ATPase